MAINHDRSSQNAQEWFGSKPVDIPGQLNFEGGEVDGPGQGTPAKSVGDGTGHRGRPGKQRRQKAPKKSKPELRPVLTHRPLTVAEVVRQRMEDNRGKGSTT